MEMFATKDEKFKFQLRHRRSRTLLDIWAPVGVFDVAEVTLRLVHEDILEVVLGLQLALLPEVEVIDERGLKSGEKVLAT